MDGGGRGAKCLYTTHVASAQPWYRNDIIDAIIRRCGFIAACIVYFFVGAFALKLFETGHHESVMAARAKARFDLESSIQYLKSICWMYHEDRMAGYDRFGLTDRTQLVARITHQLRSVETHVLKTHEESGADIYGSGDDEMAMAWTFTRTFLFCVILITTIGYGQLVPKTNGGKMFCVLYALVGIPAVLYLTNKIIPVLTDGIRFVYNRVICFTCKSKREEYEDKIAGGGRSAATNDSRIKRLQIFKFGTHTTHSSLFEEDEKCGCDGSNFMTDDGMGERIPLTLTVTIVLSYLMLGSIVFSHVEEGWSLVASFYFCFISLTTIGLGDMVPVTAFTVADPTAADIAIMVFTIVYMFLGVILVILLVNIVHDSMSASAHTYFDDSFKTEWVRMSKDNRIIQTPIGMTGNEVEFNRRRHRANQDLKKKKNKKL